MADAELQTFTSIMDALVRISVSSYICIVKTTYLHMICDLHVAVI